MGKNNNVTSAGSNSPFAKKKEVPERLGEWVSHINPNLFLLSFSSSCRRNLDKGFSYSYVY